MVLNDLFDAYGLQARLQPALLTLLPALFTLAGVWPALYAGASALVGLLIVCGSLVWLAHVARTAGRRHEKRLLATWGGWPSTIMLRHSDPQLDAQTKARYCGNLSKQIPGWVAPSAEAERSDPARADESYSSAVKWLLEHTRDNALLLRENISYGFRRNLRGLRTVGVGVAALSLLGAGFTLWERAPASIDGLLVLACLVSAVALTGFLFMVTDEWVREAGNTYALRLLACCDKL